jgi:ATP-dependent exoDNAse (exonuclease V) beta subunit
MKKHIKESYNRILEISEDSQQITLPDSRYYKRNNKYYPSLTYILQYYPKGKQFENWLKQVGYSSEYLLQKAADEGTQVHKMVEDYLLGIELKLIDDNNKIQYDPNIWQMFLKFVEFWETYNPKLIETEVHLFSDRYEIAGTCDLVCEINNEIWIIDVKTSNNLYNSYDLQVTMYGYCFEECFGKKANRYGVLWLKSSKRKQVYDKFQGKGWELYEPPLSFEENLKIFEAIHTIFKLENPQINPEFTQLRTSAKRNI